MPTLLELQAGFVTALLHDDTAPIGAEIAGDGLSVEARLAVYRHHLLSSLTAVLETSYPVVARLVGPGFFRYVSNGYVRSHPPTGPCLFEYGETFAEFLAAFPACASHPYLADVARLEWAMHAALHAEEEIPVTPAALAVAAPDDVGRLVLRLDPGAAWLRSPWPIDRIWRVNQPDADPATTVDLGAGGARLEVRRRAVTVGFRNLRAAEFAWRAALAGGLLLEGAAEAAMAEEPAFDVAAALRALLDEALLVGVSLAPRPVSA